MTVHALRAVPPAPLARALADFESGFSYPLGTDRTFRISHGEDYPRFFRSMGDASCFVSERAGRVNGVLSVAIRPLIAPDGSCQQAAYIGDLKVDPAMRGSLVFPRLARAADVWARPQVTAAFGVVMDGTRASPEGYSGRAGIPSFMRLGKIIILRIPATTQSNGNCQVVDAKSGEKCHRVLSVGRYLAAGGNPAERSEMEPRWLVHPNGLACGRLEDTRRAKRLIADDGIEMQSAHLACFAWRTPRAAAELIHAACGHAVRAGLPGLFLSIAEADMAQLEPALSAIEKVIAPASVYGAGLRSGQAWNINSSEV